jgi:hypothetical protein
MKHIITGLLFTLMSTVGWGEAYKCHYQGSPETTLVLAREHQVFLKRFELNGILSYQVHKIAFESDDELRLVQTPAYQGRQVYLNKETGAWMELHVTKTDKDGRIVEDWLVKEWHGYCSESQG